MSKKLVSFIIIATFIWIGALGAISFMEAWLKFRAPGVTLPIGLGIGKLVFSALNKIELLLAVSIVIGLIKIGNPINRQHLIIAIPVLIILLQFFWLTPVLDARADAHIAGEVVPASKAHLFYIIFEGIKMLMLWWFGIKFLMQNIAPRKLTD